MLEEGGLHANNPRYLRLEVERAGAGFGVANPGFDGGLPVRAGERFLFSAHARSAGAGADGVGMPPSCRVGRGGTSGEDSGSSRMGGGRRRTRMET